AVLNRDLWERLDRSRLPGLALVHVRGHSGDADNDRCDAIAVAFARGQLPALRRGELVASARLEADLPAPAEPAGLEVAPRERASGLSAAVVDPAPEVLQRLLGRLELADRLAAGGHGLSLAELAQLVEMPLRSLERRSAPWRWRDWQVLPLGDGRWRLEREAPGLELPP
ncbi:MAG: ribonuclease HI, partial [Cyanobium sp.]